MHAWFVRECGGGVDQCQPMAVHSEKLAELYEACRLVLAHPEQAPSVMPTESGFFFGPVDYDQYYLADMKDTVEQLKRVFDIKRTTPGTSVLIYQASW